MNKKVQTQLAKLQEDADFQFLYREFCRFVSSKTADVSINKIKINVLKVSISDYLYRKHHKAFVFFKSYEYRAVYKYFGEENFADRYYIHMSEKKEVLH